MLHYNASYLPGNGPNALFRGRYGSHGGLAILDPHAIHW